MTEDNRRDEGTKRVDAAIGALIEFFDSVQVFCTRHDPAESGGTTHVARGLGNYFSRYGQVKQWIDKENEQTKMDVHQGDEE